MRPALYRDANRTMGIVAMTGGTLVLLFWILYSAAIISFPKGDGAAAVYESAFLLADLTLTLLLVAAGYGLLRGKPYGLFCLVAAGSMSLYLGLLDFVFYFQQGLYRTLTGAAGVELVVNVLCIAGGALALRFGWRQWRRR